MADWDLQYLGTSFIPPNLSAIEIEHFFTLRPAEFDAISKSRGTSNRPNYNVAGILAKLKNIERTKALLLTIA